MVVFPFAFHIAVQQPFKPPWSRLLLYELEPSGASFALCSKPLLMTLLPASVLVSLFVWRLPFNLSSKGGPTSSYATAGIALRVTGVLKPPHHDKVEAPMRRSKSINLKNIYWLEKSCERGRRAAFMSPFFLVPLGVDPFLGTDSFRWNWFSALGGLLFAVLLKLVFWIILVFSPSKGVTWYYW